MAAIIPINVDLNKLFEAKLTYGFDHLKDVIEVRQKPLGVDTPLNG